MVTRTAYAYYRELQYHARKRAQEQADRNPCRNPSPNGLTCEREHGHEGHHRCDRGTKTYTWSF